MWRSLGSRAAIALVALVLVTGSVAVGVAAGATPTWSIAPSPSAPDGTAPTGVSCLNAADCYAVGYYQTGSAIQSWIVHWNGSSWSRMTAPRPQSTTAQYLRALTCLSTTNCFAVGTYNNPKGN